MFGNSIIAKLGLDASDFNAKLQGARARLTGMQKALGAIGVGVGVSAAVRGLDVLLAKVDDIGDKADALGVSTDFFQQFTLGARRAGLDAADAEKALEKLNLKIGEARTKGGEAADQFRRFGVAIVDASGDALPLETIVDKAADRMAEIKDPTQRARMAFELFGKGAQRLAPLLAQGAEGLRKFKEQARGQIIPKETIDNLSEAKVMLDEFYDFALKKGADTYMRLGWQWRKIGAATVDAFRDDSRTIIDVMNDAASEAKRARQLAEAASKFDPDKAERAKKVAEIEEKIAKSVRDYKMQTATASEKLAMLTAERVALEAQAATLADDLTATDIQRAEAVEAIVKARNEELDAARALQDEMDKGAKAQADARQEEIELRQKELELAKKAGDKRAEIRAQETLNNLIRARAQLLGGIANREERLAEIVKAQRAADAARAGVATARASATEQRKDLSRFTLQELSESQVQFSGRLGRDQAIARQIAQLTQFAEAQKARGFSNVADQARQRIDSLRRGLSENVVESDRKTFAEIVTEAKRQADLAEQTLQLMRGTGIVTKPTFGP